MWDHERSAVAVTVWSRAAKAEIVPPIQPVKDPPTMNPTWRTRAACTGIDSDLFYPTSEDEAEADEAKAICAVCPVSTACLEHALAFREKEGIWGGTTERERRRIHRQRRKTA